MKPNIARMAPSVTPSARVAASSSPTAEALARIACTAMASLPPGKWW
jgi:hypothetical protein